MFKCIGRKILDYFAMLTLISDVVNAVNSRPLIYVDSDNPNSAIITPNSFLKFESGRSVLLEGAIDESSSPARAEDLVKSLSRREEMLADFKSIWRDQYILSLREAGRDLFQRDWQDAVAVGDVVLIYSPIKPRYQWTMGRVTELITGSDAKTRCVRVMRPDRTEGIYSLKLLYPMELSLGPIGEVKESAQVLPEPLSERPKRLAALKCKENLAKYN